MARNATANASTSASAIERITIAASHPTLFSVISAIRSPGRTRESNTASSAPGAAQSSVSVVIIAT